MNPWALWIDAEGGAHVRPLFPKEPRGHGYTRPLEPHETRIECEDGAYPDKAALSTPEYQAKRVAQAEAQKPVTRAELDAVIEKNRLLEERLSELEKRSK